MCVSNSSSVFLFSQELSLSLLSPCHTSPQPAPGRDRPAYVGPGLPSGTAGPWLGTAGGPGPSTRVEGGLPGAAHSVDVCPQAAPTEPHHGGCCSGWGEWGSGGSEWEGGMEGKEKKGEFVAAVHILRLGEIDRGGGPDNLWGNNCMKAMEKILHCDVDRIK